MRQKRTHIALRKKHRTPFFVFHTKISRQVVVVVLMSAGVRPRRASGCHFQVSCACWGLECVSRAFWGCQPRREWVSLGLSAHHVCIDAGSGRRLNLNHKSLVACVHGVVNVCSVVVRTTEKMVIHWECGTYHQRRYLSTKRDTVFTSMRVLVFCQLQRPGAKRTLVLGLQSQNVACGGGNGAAGLDLPRVRTSVFHRNRRRTWK